MAVASLASSAFTRIGDELGPETTRLKSVFPTDMILSVSGTREYWLTILHNSPCWQHARLPCSPYYCYFRLG